MKIYAGSDHAGFKLRQHLMEVARGLGHEVVDLGTETADRVDYPDFGGKVGRAVAGDPGSRGLLCCGLRWSQLLHFIYSDRRPKYSVYPFFQPVLRIARSFLGIVSLW